MLGHLGWLIVMGADAAATPDTVAQPSAAVSQPSAPVAPPPQAEGCDSDGLTVDGWMWTDEAPAVRCSLSLRDPSVRPSTIRLLTPVSCLPSDFNGGGGESEPLIDSALVRGPPSSRARGGLHARRGPFETCSASRAKKKKDKKRKKRRWGGGRRGG